MMPDDKTRSKEARRVWLGRARVYLDVAASVAMLAASGALVWLAVSAAARAGGRSGSESTLPAEPIPLDGARTLGTDQSPAVLVIFSDFQCPFCRRFARETLPTIESKYVSTGRLAVAFRHFPLRMHSFAPKAAAGAECAGRQGKFWKMHDALFAAVELLDEKDLVDVAVGVGLEPKAFQECLVSNVGLVVDADMKLGASLQIASTPTSFLGTRTEDGKVKAVKKLSGARPVGDFEAAIEEVIGSVQEVTRRR